MCIRDRSWALTCFWWTWKLVKKLVQRPYLSSSRTEQHLVAEESTLSYARLGRSILRLPLSRFPLWKEGKFAFWTILSPDMFLTTLKNLQKNCSKTILEHLKCRTTPCGWERHPGLDRVDHSILRLPLNRFPHRKSESSLLRSFRTWLEEHSLTWTHPWAWHGPFYFTLAIE